ncbi:MAG: carboxypeptidase-like regulatory domain-containing protein [Blastocatellia bacterium]
MKGQNQNLVETCFKTFLAKCLLICSLLLSANSAFAQTTNGRIVVTVKDQTGAVIAGANIKIINEGTNQEVDASTNESGTLVSPLLPIGKYTLSIEADGFKKAVSENVKLDVGQEYGIVVALETGGTEEVITVSAGEELLQTTNAEVKNIVTEKQIQELPLDGRSPLRLIQLQAGVNGDLARTNTVINGQRSSSANLTQDGINIQDLFIRSNALDFSPNRPTVAQVSEFSVTTLNPGAETSGASSIRFATPSGTNTFHGSVFEFHRNSALGANDFFSNQFNIEKPQLIRNQYGYTLSGPVTIPGVINGKDKLFFFTYFEGFRQRNGSPTIGGVLLPNARQGIFTYRDNGGQVRTLDILGLKNLSIDPFIANILSRVPNQTNTQLGDGLNTGGFAFNKAITNDRDVAGFRIDYNYNARHRFEGVYQHASENVARPDIDTSFNLKPLVSSVASTDFFVVSWNFAISPRLNNELRVGRNITRPEFVTNEDLSSGSFVNTPLITNPVATFLGQGRTTEITSIIDGASAQFGKHFIRFGGQADFTRVRSFNDAGTVPTFGLGISVNAPQGFGLVARDFPGGIDGIQLNTANALLTLLSGTVSSAAATFNATSQTSGFVKGAGAVKRLEIEQYSGYITDSWRVRPNLTINLGLRYDFVTPLHERNNFALQPSLNARPDGQSDPKSLVLNPLGRIDFVDGFFFDSDKNNFAPNISVAWDIPGLGRQTVLRGGYSIQYINDEAFRAPDNATSANPGLSTTVSLPGLFGTVTGNRAEFANALAAPPFRVPNTFAQAFAINPGAAAFIVDPNFKTPYYQQYNISIEREVLKDTVLTVRYVGNRSTNLARGVDFNQVEIRKNGFLQDFIRARQNGFLALARNGVFDPRFNAAISGSQQLSVFPSLGGAGLLNNATVRALILSGEAGTLAQVYFQNRLSGSVQLVPNPNIFVADVLLNGASSDYNSLQIEGRRRFSSGLILQANYTFSKTLTDAQGTGQTRFEPFLDNDQPRLERSRATFDVTNSFKSNFIYELPFGEGPGKLFSPSNRILKKLVSGFQISSIIGVQTGAPLTIFSGRGTLNRGARSGGNTVDTNLSIDEIKKLLGTFVMPDGRIFFIDPKVIGRDGRGVAPDGQAPFAGQVFFNPEPGQVGSLARFEFNGPTAYNIDFSVIKKTNITERVNMEFRAEFFNVFNNAVFLVGDLNVNSTTFGRVNSTLTSPRVIQLGAKINF